MGRCSPRRWSCSRTSQRPTTRSRSSWNRVGFLPAEIEPDALGDLRRARVYVGYAGWGPGQLDGELEEGSWIVEPAKPDDVFTNAPEALWSDVLRRKGGPFTLLAAMPPDPSQN